MCLIADLHCDTLGFLGQRENGFVSAERNDLMIDIEKLEKGGVALQCFAVFVPTGDAVERHYPKLGPWEYFLHYHKAFEDMLSAYPDRIKRVRNYNDLQKSISEKKIGAMLTVEDGVLIDGKAERIKQLYDMGVRIITVTWNYENCLAYPNGSSGGLKKFGSEAVEQMLEYGIIPDVSHLSDKGFDDVYEICRRKGKPFMATHSCARALCGHRRNLTDEMLHKIGECGGAAGVNFFSKFLNDDGTYSYIDDIVRHMRYMADKGGVESIAIGSDFDGIDRNVEIKDSSYFPLLADRMKKFFTEDETEKICCKNAARVIKEICR